MSAATMQFGGVDSSSISPASTGSAAYSDAAGRVGRGCKLISRLCKRQVNNAVMEASGGYERVWAKVLPQPGIEVADTLGASSSPRSTKSTCVSSMTPLRLVDQCDHTSGGAQKPSCSARPSTWNAGWLSGEGERPFPRRIRRVNPSCCERR